MATNLRPIPDTPRPAGTRGKVQSNLKWLYPGMRVKRWLLLIPLGMVPILLGVLSLIGLRTVEIHERMEIFLLERLGVTPNVPAVYVPLGITLILIGMAIILTAFALVNRSIVQAIAPDSLSELPDKLHRRIALSQGAKTVALGGGTGLSTLLRGLKQYTSNLTAVVTMTDDGGSSGLLQRQLVAGILPPGDIRNCLVALADSEPRMQELFQYRFETRDEKDGLYGHSFGNLLIAAMADITGDFERAVEETSTILNIRGRVLPTSVDSVVLVGEMADGTEITGETSIAGTDVPIQRIKLCPDSPKPLSNVIEAIRQAEIIVMGPGSVFTSIIPNLLVKEIAQAVAASPALKVYVCNVMTQPGETDDFTASDHVRVIEEHVAPFLTPRQRIFDYVLVNAVRPSSEALARYQNVGAEFVVPDVEKIAAMGYKPVKGNFISERTVVRHDPEKIARAVLRLFSERPFMGK
jgi:uncharacterized cofD-like protein